MIKRCIILALMLACVPTVAADDSSSPTTTHAEMVASAMDFMSTRQGDDGAYSKVAGPGITALVTTGLLRNGRSPDDPQIAGSLKYLEGMVQPSGGIHRPESLYRNYETSLAMMCFAAANVDGRYDELLENATTFVKSIQWDEGEGHSRDDPAYGGAGYGKHKRPDLSNTTFLVDALHAVGEGADSEAIQRALVFVSRAQNLDSPHNNTGFAAKVNDGGFYYTPAAGGTSQAGETANGGLRSYGSMTYAGLKSMIYAGVDSNDPRVKAAIEWIRRNYDLKTNPGIGDAGLYYYYHTFAKALDALGQDLLVADDDSRHDWRAELNRELASRQQPNGSWINENERWLEGNPDLVTGYVLLTLSYTKPTN